MNTFKLKQDIGKLIFNGYDREGIKRTICGHAEFRSMPEDQRKDLESTLDALIDDNQNFTNAQRILSSKILVYLDSNRTAMYDPVSYSESPASWDAITRSIKTDIARDQMIQCYRVYDPRTPQKFFNVGSRKFFNCYMPPAWRNDNFFYGHEIPKSELPAIHKEFFTAFVNGSNKNLNYLLNWAANSLHNKNNAALTLVGKEGTGKSLLASILGAVHGNERMSKNYNSIRGTTLGSQFNSNLADKTLINFDEIHIKDEKEFSYFKTLVNNEIEVERKGQDSQVQDNYANIVMSTNHTTSFKLGVDGDRRFAIIDITEVPLAKQPFVGDNLPGYVERLLDPKAIKQLGEFLWHFKVDIQLMSQPYISATKDSIRKDQLSDWKEHFLESYCREKAGETVSYTNVVADLSLQLDQSASRMKISTGDFKELEGQVKAFLRDGSKWLFNVKRVRNELNQRPYFLTFADLDQQPENLMENFSKPGDT